MKLDDKEQAQSACPLSSSFIRFQGFLRELGCVSQGYGLGPDPPNHISIHSSPAPSSTPKIPSKPPPYLKHNQCAFLTGHPVRDPLQQRGKKRIAPPVQHRGARENTARPQCDRGENDNNFDWVRESKR
eukprot:gene17574-biopygen572